MRAPAILAVLLLAAAQSSGSDAVDEDLVPGGRVLSTIFPAGEVETFRVAAPEGSTLLVTLGPLKRGLFAPALAATLSDGSEASLPAPSKAGATKASLPFPVDGVLVLRVSSGRGGAGDYALRTRLGGPRGADFTGSVEGGGGAAVGFSSPPGSLATVAVKAAKGGALVPRILALEAPGGPAEAGATRHGTASDLWTRTPLAGLGPWTLTVGGADGTTGAFTASVRWRAPRGAPEDRRAFLGPSTVEGSYAALLASTGSPGGASLPAVLTGSVDLDPKGRAKTALSTLGVAPDASGPLGFSLSRTPIPGSRGTCVSDGSSADLALDLGDGRSLAAGFTVAAGGSVLYAGAGDPAAPLTGLLLRRTPVPTVEELAGSWLYVDVKADGSGGTAVEIGTLTFSASGVVAGVGASTPVTLVAGTPTPGAQGFVIRTGSLGVGADGTVTLITVPNIVGAAEAWTARTVLGADVLAGLDASGGGARLLLRQGTGLSAADATGPYLHFGIALGTALGLRTGVLDFDGAGGFSGQESVVDLAGGSPGTSEAVTGSYSVNATGVATFGIDGSPPGTGIIGPAGRYLFSVSLGSGGVGVDFLLSLK